MLLRIQLVFYFAIFFQNRAYSDTLSVFLNNERTDLPITIPIGTDIPIPKIISQKLGVSISFMNPQKTSSVRLAVQLINFPAKQRSRLFFKGKIKWLSDSEFELESSDVTITGFGANDSTGVLMNFFLLSNGLKSPIKSNSIFGRLSVQQKLLNSSMTDPIKVISKILRISLRAPVYFGDLTKNNTVKPFRLVNSDGCSAEDSFILINNSGTFQVSGIPGSVSVRNNNRYYFFSKSCRADLIPTTGNPIINFESRPTLVVPIKIWVDNTFPLQQKGFPNNTNYLDIEALIRANVDLANEKFRESYMGIKLDYNNVVNACQFKFDRNTHDSISAKKFCSEDSKGRFRDNGIYSTDTLNVYFIDLYEDKKAGFGCNKCVIASMPDIQNLIYVHTHAFNDTFIHEAGHFLGLGHSTDPTNLMYVGGGRHQTNLFTLGQAFKANFNKNSGLHNGSVELNHNRLPTFEYKCGYATDSLGNDTHGLPPINLQR
jgi:hypothetical protein